MVNPDRVAFTLFGRDIYWYGVLMAVGIILAVALAIAESRRKNMPKDSMVDIALVVIPSGIVGARLYYVLFELETYLQDPIRILYIWEGGLAIYGAVIGGFLGAFIYGRIKKLCFLRIADCIAPGLVLAQAIGRWGNFFNQEAFGNPVTNPDLWWFPLSVRIDIPHTYNGYVNGVLLEGVCENPYHLATFFYESMWCLLIFIVLWFVLRKRIKHDGDILLWYALLYGLERMVVEGLRGDSLWLVRPGGEVFTSGIRVSQLISFIVVVAVAVFMLVRALREKKLGRCIWPSPLPEAAAAGGAEGCGACPAAQAQEAPKAPAGEENEAEEDAAGSAPQNDGGEG